MFNASQSFILIFVAKELIPENNAQNNPISDYELAKELQEV